MFSNLKSNKARVSLAMTMLACILLLAGCGDHSISGAGSSDGESGTGKLDKTKDDFSSSSIKLDLGIASKRVSVNDSRLLESNIGTSFNSIVPVTLILEPGMSEELQNIQPNGIFALYLSADGDFTLTNSDGLNFTVKSILMEKCSFIDLKITNNFHRKMEISGFLAGE